jgi:hypothetical protein
MLIKLQAIPPNGIAPALDTGDLVLWLDMLFRSGFHGFLK